MPLQPDFSGASLLAILNHRNENDLVKQPILDVDTLSYLSGALVFIELARLRLVDPNSFSGVWGSAGGGGAPGSKLEDTFRIRPAGSEDADKVVEYRSRLSAISTLKEDGASLGRYILESESKGIEAALMLDSARYSLIEAYGRIARGEPDDTGYFYAARSLAALLSRSATGRSVSAKLGQIDEADVVEVFTQKSVWNEGDVNTTILVIISMISGVVNDELERRYS